MNIGQIIQGLIMGRNNPFGSDPASALASTGGAAPPTLPPADIRMGPVPTPEQATPMTMPTEAPVSETMKSPPDLASMYMELMESGQRNARWDRFMSGASLFAAGFPQSPQDRALLVGMSRGGFGGDGSSGGSAGAPSVEDLINMQKFQQESEDRQRRLDQLGPIAEGHGLTPEDTNYLDSMGQLDELLTKLNEPNVEIVEGQDGSKILIDKNTGAQSIVVPGKRKTEWRTNADGSQTLVYEDDKTPVVGEPENVQIGAPPKPISIETLADGRKQAFRDGEPVGEPVGPGTDLRTDDIKEWELENQGRAARGEAPIGLMDYIKQIRTAGATTITNNLGPTGIDYGKPSPGFAWKRDPEGNVVTDENGAPVMVPIKTSPEYEEQQLKRAAEQRAAEEHAVQMRKDTAEQSEAEQAAEQAAESEAASDTNKVVKNFMIMKALDRAIYMTENQRWYDPASGFLAPFVRTIRPGGSAAETLESELATINAQTAFEQLKEMRLAAIAAGASTGASGLGQVTDKEQRMLQSVWADVSQGQWDEALLLKLKNNRRAVELLATHDYPDTAEGRAQFARDMEGAQNYQAEDPYAETEEAPSSGYTIERVD